MLIRGNPYPYVDTATYTQGLMQGLLGFFMNLTFMAMFIRISNHNNLLS